MVTKTVILDRAFIKECSDNIKKLPIGNPMMDYASICPIAIRLGDYWQVGTIYAANLKTHEQIRLPQEATDWIRKFDTYHLTGQLDKVPELTLELTIKSM